MAVQDARHNTDHYLFLGCLCRAAPATHPCYLGRRTRFPIRPPKTQDRLDRMFAELRRAIPRPPRQECYRQACISSETWSLIDTRITARHQKDQRSSRALRCAIKAGIQEDRRIQASKVGSVVESLLASDPPFIRKAWVRIQGWYKATVECAPLSHRVALATIMAEREELYRNIPPLGEPIPVEDLPLMVDDYIP